MFIFLNSHWRHWELRVLRNRFYFHASWYYWAGILFKMLPSELAVHSFKPPALLALQYLILWSVCYCGRCNVDRSWIETMPGIAALNRFFLYKMFMPHLGSGGCHWYTIVIKEWQYHTKEKWAQKCSCKTEIKINSSLIPQCIALVHNTWLFLKQC